MTPWLWITVGIGGFLVVSAALGLAVTAILAQISREISELLDRLNVRTLASYGVGGAVVELWLHRLSPERRLRLTDYAPETVERLRELFHEAEVVRHDLLTDAPLEADLHLFHRIDTELTNAEWREVLGRFAQDTVLVVATEIADASRILREQLGRLRTRGLTRAGWLRNREAFEALWRPTHDAAPLRFNDLDGWLLEPRSKSPA